VSLERFIQEGKSHRKNPNIFLKGWRWKKVNFLVFRRRWVGVEERKKN